MTVEATRASCLVLSTLLALVVTKASMSLAGTELQEDETTGIERRFIIPLESLSGPWSSLQLTFHNPGLTIPIELRVDSHSALGHRSRSAAVSRMRWSLPGGDSRLEIPLLRHSSYDEIMVDFFQNGQPMEDLEINLVASSVATLGIVIIGDSATRLGSMQPDEDSEEEAEAWITYISTEQASRFWQTWVGLSAIVAIPSSAAARLDEAQRKALGRWVRFAGGVMWIWGDQVSEAMRQFGFPDLKEGAHEVGTGLVFKCKEPEFADLTPETYNMLMSSTLDHPDEGDVLVDGVPAVNFPDRVRWKIGFMPDYDELYSDMVVSECLDFYARAYRLPPPVRRRRIEDVVAFTRLEKLLDRPLTGLSKGERQRLGLGRVLVHDPSVLILDEPAAGLDPRARIELRALLRTLADRGKAVLVSSHILSELSAVCDQITIVENGRVCASGSVRGLRDGIKSESRVSVELDAPGPQVRERLATVLSEHSAVLHVETSLAGASFRYAGGQSVRAGLLQILIREGFKVTDFHVLGSDLEDAFLELTENRSGRGNGE